MLGGGAMKNLLNAEIRMWGVEGFKEQPKKRFEAKAGA